jgi:glycosyltransferase involved in cell wall biosynthesis
MSEMSTNLLEFVIPFRCDETHLPATLVASLKAISTNELASAIVVADQCSQAIVDQLQSQVAGNPSLSLVMADEPLGPGAARNLGLLHASAPFVAFVDADDIVDLDGFVSMMNLARSHDADLVVSGYRIVDRAGRELEASVPPTAEPPEVLQCMLRRVGIWRCVLRRSFLGQHDVAFEALSYGEDLLWAVDLSAARPRTSYLHRVSYTYVWSGAGQLSTKRVSSGDRQSLIRLLKSRSKEPASAYTGSFLISWMLRILVRGVKERDARGVMAAGPWLLWAAVRNPSRAVSARRGLAGGTALTYRRR